MTLKKNKLADAHLINFKNRFFYFEFLSNVVLISVDIEIIYG